MPPEPTTGAHPVVDAPTARDLAASAPPPDPRRHLHAAEEEAAGPLVSRRRRKVRARKVRRVVRHVEPWSVLKVSLLFYLCLGLILLVAGVALWSVGRSTGAIENTESFITELGFGDCVDRETLDPGTEFREDDGCAEQGEGFVLVGGFTFEDRTLLQGAAVVGLILIIAGAAANTILAVLFNLISDLTGGVRVTVLEEQPAPKPGPAQPRDG